MTMKISSLDRRKFLRGSGVALALPWFESFNQIASAASPQEKRKRLACFYLPDGVPMPLEKDPSFNDWSWFPHGAGKDFTLTKCMETLEPLEARFIASGCKTCTWARTNFLQGLILGRWRLSKQHFI